MYHSQNENTSQDFTQSQKLEHLTCHSTTDLQSVATHDNCLHTLPFDPVSFLKQNPKHLPLSPLHLHVTSPDLPPLSLLPWKLRGTNKFTNEVHPMNCRFTTLLWQGLSPWVCVSETIRFRMFWVEPEKKKKEKKIKIIPECPLFSPASWTCLPVHTGPEPAQRSRAVRRRWQCLFLGSVPSSQTAPPTCPPPWGASRAHTGCPSHPGKYQSQWLATEYTHSHTEHTHRSTRHSDPPPPTHTHPEHTHTHTQNTHMYPHTHTHSQTHTNKTHTTKEMFVPAACCQSAAQTHIHCRDGCGGQGSGCSHTPSAPSASTTGATGCGCVQSTEKPIYDYLHTDGTVARHPILFEDWTQDI